MPLKLVPPRKGRSPNWRVRGTYLGVYVDESTGTPKYAVAQAKLQEVIRAIERGEIARAGEPTFLSAAVAYMEAGGERRYLEPLIEHFGATALRKINQQAVDEAAGKFYPPGISSEPSPHNATINRQVHTPVGCVLAAGGIPLRLKRPKQPKPTARWIEPEQATVWLKACSPKLRRLSVYLLYTGCRITEACDLMGEHVSLRHKMAYLPETKNGESRAVHLPPAVIAELKAIKPKADEPVFGYRDRWHVYDDWAPLREKLAFPSWWTPHACCHTWATWMRRYAGKDLRGLLGTGRWKDLKSVLRYQHVDTTEESRSADLLPDVRNPWSRKRKRGKSAA